jgi:nucleotide-binding universal stress UspA family protein
MIVAEAATVSIPYTEKDLKQIKKRAMEYLNETAARLRKKGAIVKCKVVVGKAADEIIRTEAVIKADLVAMSTHGRSGFSRWAFGSVTDRVLRGGSVPVLMIRAHE